MGVVTGKDQQPLVGEDTGGVLEKSMSPTSRFEEIDAIKGKVDGVERGLFESSQIRCIRGDERQTWKPPATYIDHLLHIVDADVLFEQSNSNMQWFDRPLHPHRESACTT